MLITTSRKPSARTRSFSRSLNRILKSKYINRGKMSIRDVLLKSYELGLEKIAIISEIKGNPNKIDFYNVGGERVLTLDIRVALPKSKVILKKDELSIRCEVRGLRENIIEAFSIPEDLKADSNLILVRRGREKAKAIIEIYDENGSKTDLRIYVDDWGTEDGDSRSSGM
jgi:U3 small nucleolar ribonucleoprotein protein IMP4